MLKVLQKTRFRIALVSLLLPFTAVAAEVGTNPELHRRNIAHGEPRLEKVTERVYVARAYDAVNFMFVLGDKGVIVVDTSWHVETAQRALDDLRKITQKPITAVIYSHGHVDHTAGVRAFIPPGKEGEIPIYALSNWRIYQNERVNPTFFMNQRRAQKQFDTERMRDGKDLMFAIGPLRANAPTISYLPPTIDLEIEQLKEKEVTIDGVRFVFTAVDSEINDEMVIWLPDEKVAYAADVIGDMMPWMQTPRYEPRRRHEGFYEGAEILEAWKPQSLVLGHGLTIIDDPAAVQRLIAIQKAGIRTMIDQVVYHANQGHSRDETVARVKLPSHLADEDHLVAYHHSQSTIIRGLWTNVAGWFGGDALEMIQHTPTEQARRIVALAGGQKTVLKNADKALSSGDYPWAAQLATYVLTLDSEEVNAKRIKAAAFRELAALTFSSTERAYLSTESKMLDGSFRPAKKGDAALTAQSDSGRSVPSKNLIELFPAYFDYRRGEQESIIVNLKITDRDETFGIHMDRGVLFRQSVPFADAEATVSLTHGELLAISFRKKRFAEMNLEVEGNAAEAARLFEILDL